MLLIEDNGRCNSCQNYVKTDYKRGRVVCDNCGLVKESNFVDQQSEYRYFSENTKANNDPRRVGSNINTHLDAQIDLVDIDDGKNSYHVFAAQSNSDKYFYNASKLIKKYCGILGLQGQIIKFSQNIIYEVMDKQGLRGKRLEHVVMATIYLACKRNYVNIHPVSLEPLCDIKQNQLLKICKIIIKELPPITVTPAQYAEMFCNKMNVASEYKKDIIKICQDIINWDIFDNKLPKPKTIAATVIYFYLSKLNILEQKSLSDIKDAAGICTDNTIKKYYQSLEGKINYLNQLLGKDLRVLNQGLNETGYNQICLKIYN